MSSGDCANINPAVVAADTARPELLLKREAVSIGGGPAVPGTTYAWSSRHGPEQPQYSQPHNTLPNLDRCTNHADLYTLDRDYGQMAARPRVP
jgi:hypothetical protein